MRTRESVLVTLGAVLTASGLFVVLNPTRADGEPSSPLTAALNDISSTIVLMGATSMLVGFGALAVALLMVHQRRKRE